ncbi:transcription factor Opi1, partial [Teratosphaeria nubilosa]
VGSPSESSVLGADHHGTRTKSGVSLEDQEVRDVAEALIGLGGSGRTVRSPSVHVLPLPHAMPRPDAIHREQEPLLQLFTQAHPVPGAIINGSMSAYSGAKSLTPRFVRAGIDVAERNIGSPMVNAVGNVGRTIGAERAARWYLTPRDHADASPGDEAAIRSKRRRVDEHMDIEAAMPDDRARRGSVGSQVDSLPAYRASRPPSYREEASPATLDRAQPHERRPEHSRTWSQHLMYSASGLGVAMSETSRRSLLYCLQILGRSAEHIATVSDALRLVLEQYDQARDHWHQNNDAAQAEKGERPKTPEHDDSARRLAGIIQKHCDDIWQTLKTVVASVSSSAGGALPVNAREFVRGQLLSLPLRWRRVSDGQTMESETSRSAHRMVAFATEGLDMIGQVGQMCKATLDSAEGWVNMVGRR